MDVNKIFGLFGNDETEPLKERVQHDDVLLKDYKNHPLFWVGMFKKLLQNHQIFNKQLLDFFNKSDEKLDIDDVNKAGDFIVFSKAWEFIEKINPEDKVCQEALYNFADGSLKEVLEMSILYFQECEEYEKCAHLKKNLDFVKLLLT